MPKELIAAIVLAVLFIIFLLPNFKIVKLNEACVVERMGSFHRVIDQPGIYFLIPLFERVIQQESLLPKTRELLLNDKSFKTTYSYTYQIKDIKLFCYAALDSLKLLEEKMIDYINATNDHLDALNELSQTYGVEILKIDEINN